MTASTWSAISQTRATSNLARFRDSNFQSIEGIAYDDPAHILYISETGAHRLHAVTLVDPADENTWTIEALANVDAVVGFADGPAATARFRHPAGLFLDAATHALYVADAGNHVIRAIDLKNGIAAATVSTVFGTPETLGFFGDDKPANGALLYRPRALTRCPNGDFFLSDTGNNRVRRVAASDGNITTVLGDGVAASSGQGVPSSLFPVHAPQGLACDTLGNVFVTSSSAVRLLLADNDTHLINGTGIVQTLFGVPPRTSFPSSVSNCLSGIAIVDATTVRITDSCAGLLVDLKRQPKISRVPLGERP